MKKNNYVTPESELLIVRFEENFCFSPNPSNDNTKTEYLDDEVDGGNL